MGALRSEGAGIGLDCVRCLALDVHVEVVLSCLARFSMQGSRLVVAHYYRSESAKAELQVVNFLFARVVSTEAAYVHEESSEKNDVPTVGL